jgi:hypothetical protein
MSTEFHQPLSHEERFNFLREEITAEQELYWTRFAGFATLHAGLLVLITSDTVAYPKMLSAAAFVLAFVWLYVQCGSLWYVNRLKPQFGKMCEQGDVQYPKHWLFSHKWCSTTDIALIAPFLLILLWVILFFTATPKMPPMQKLSMLLMKPPVLAL